MTDTSKVMNPVRNILEEIQHTYIRIRINPEIWIWIPDHFLLKKTWDFGLGGVGLYAPEHVLLFLTFVQKFK